MRSILPEECVRLHRVVDALEESLSNIELESSHPDYRKDTLRAVYGLQIEQGENYPFS